MQDQVQSLAKDAKAQRREQSRLARYSLLERLSRMDHNTIIGIPELAALINRSANSIQQWCSDAPNKLPPRLPGHGRNWRLGTVLDWIQERDMNGRGMK